MVEKITVELEKNDTMADAITQLLEWNPNARLRKIENVTDRTFELELESDEKIILEDPKKSPINKMTIRVTIELPDVSADAKLTDEQYNALADAAKDFFSNMSSEEFADAIKSAKLAEEDGDMEEDDESDDDDVDCLADVAEIAKSVYESIFGDSVEKEDTKKPSCDKKKPEDKCSKKDDYCYFCEVSRDIIKQLAKSNPKLMNAESMNKVDTCETSELLTMALEGLENLLTLIAEYRDLAVSQHDWIEKYRKYMKPAK